MDYDVIVIGAGLGGLTAGAKLAKEGKKVLFFASAWTEPGHGFTGAIMSGYWCAEEILRTW